MGAEFIGELIDTYCQETPQLIAALQQALAQGDAPAFQRAAHSIKSTSASLGAMEFPRRPASWRWSGAAATSTAPRPRWSAWSPTMSGCRAAY